MSQPFVRGKAVLALGAALTVGAAILPATPVGAAESSQCAVDGAGAWQITAECVDPLYTRPVIDSETDETAPVPHHRVSGHFEGTNIQFTIYLHPEAEKEKWDGRFFQYTYPTTFTPGTNTSWANDRAIEFSLASGGYTVQAGNDFLSLGYRHDAAAAKFAEQIAAKYYDSDREIFGYLYGPSGGSLQTVGAAENVQGVWQGFVPVVQAVPNPNSYPANGRSAAELILADKANDISDALLPGGSGDPYATLDEAEKAMLTELHLLGIPWQAWENPAYLLGYDTRYFGAGLDSDTPLAYDPTYVDDFWNAPGYLGTEESSLGARVRAELAEMGDTVGHRWNIAKRFAYRYQLPADGTGWIALDQFRNADGTPIYPQRAVGEPPRFGSVSGNTAFDGSVNGKVIVVSNLYDVDALPIHTDWYRKRVEQSLGNAAADTYRVYFNDRADHQEGEVPQDRSAYLVPFYGMVEQALRDIARWAEDDVAAPASTQYEIVKSQVVVGSDADARGGIQPTASLSVNGSDRAEVETGQTVTLNLTADAPDGLGAITKTSFDYLGSGSFEDVPFGEPANEVSTSATHIYPTAGTVFAGARAAADREGDVADPNAQVLNLDRVRVVVHEGAAPIVAAAFEGQTVTLNATDDYSGVAAIEYRTIKKGGQPSAWQAYTGPIKVTGSKTVVEYRATDNSGKISEVASVTAPAKTTVTGAVDRHLVRAGASVKYTIAVKADDNTSPTGTITVTDNGQVVATVNLTADARGKTTVTIPALKRGGHVLIAKFSGDGFIGSTSRPDLVIAR
ncbi:Ig-like domain (group 3) [Rathayibacter oskolensis]|uniref:Ig-like domain (Group 3) n=1 Tax=Rathayibacter oskolensis TaxID=1891671 RepID=A0A1X7P254_9MICO|nr:Ig-like domain repeat protein [Rathayibacter oskolensis]SMH44212.1 Ig-like domain (group 3) [Rathayibacter oskolensis]